MSLSKPSKDGNGNRWKSFYDSSRKFKTEWQKKYPWIQKATDGSDDAYCSICRANITPKLSNIGKHEQSAKHNKNANLIQRNAKITLKPAKQDNDIKEMELQVALAVTCHTSIMAVDHLNEIMVKYGKGSRMEHMKLHRTKCSRLIEDMTVPAMFKVHIQPFHISSFYKF